MSTHEGGGFVWLVGAGPGDPGLLTLAGARRIAEADVLVYDRLVSTALLERAREGAERIYVGKGPKEHTLTQDEINALLIDRARRGLTVVRLKGGDPFVFGRGGEEAEALRAAGLPFGVVPGVTSAIAAPAYAGIPLTHRAMASSFAVVTGHEDPAKPDATIAWEKLATGVDTLVFLMGVANLGLIVQRLVEHGRSPHTPVAVVASGTLPRQQTITGTLHDIVARVAESGVRPPAVTIVGEVARLRESLAWFDARPLFGKRVLVTRARHQASVLAEMLSDAGADVVQMPTIEIRETYDAATVRAAIGRLANGWYAWTVFTSANAVEILWRQIEAARGDARALRCKVAAIGPGTAEALLGHGIRADLVPERFVAEGLLDAFAREELAGRRMLLPRAGNARDVLPEGLRARGAEVEVVELYRAAPPEPDAAVLEDLRSGAIDAVTFASSSTVRNLATMLGGSLAVLEGALVASIGPITSEALRQCGRAPDVEAGEHTIQGLVAALERAVEALENAPSSVAAKEGAPR